MFSFPPFFEQLFFRQSKGIIRLSRNKILQAEDMLPLPDFLHPQKAPPCDLDTSGGWSLIRSLAKSGKKLLLAAFFLNLAYTLFGLVKPVLLNKFVAEVSLGFQGDSLARGITYAILFGVVSLISVFCLQHYFLRVLHTQQIFGNILNEKIFRKSLFLSQAARQKTPVGDIVNHMGSDSDSVSDLGLIFGDLLLSLVTILGVSALLFVYLGQTAWVSLGLLASMVPLTNFIAKKFSHIDDVLMKHRDERVSLMTQALNGIRVVKFYAWEKSIKAEVAKVRKNELDSRKQLARAEALATLSYAAVSTVVLFSTFATHVYWGGKLEPALVFTCVALFAHLEDPFSHLSSIISRVAAAKVGADRIGKFLREEELKEDKKQEQLLPPAITVEGLSLRHAGSSLETLKNISFQLQAGESLAIIGPVGSGKSSLLQAFLKEIPLAAGQIRFHTKDQKDIHPRVAYVPQEAFIMSGSLAENIQFGEKENSILLQSSLYASCLEADLNQLPAGLYTEIGERGLNLSGGQKQRISLARAVMHQPSLVLLDDPLSAVDVKTESLLCERLLFGLWKSLTRIVVTHRLSELERFDKIAFLQEGKLLAYGSFTELLHNCQEFRSFYQESGKAESEGQNLKNSADLSHSMEAIPQKSSRLTDDEDRAVGAVKKTVYWDYLKALGGKNQRALVWILLLGGTALGCALPLLQKAWLALASSVQYPAQQVQQTWPAFVLEWAKSPENTVWVYGFLSLITLSFALLNRLFWLERGIAAGRDLHDDMLRAVLKAPMRFFDATPIGRILQRFSRDVESVDIHLQWSFETTVRCLVNIATALFLILGTLPLMVFVFLPVMFFYYRLQKDYRVPAREAKRLDSISRSPRYAHFKETLQGLVVIRSYRKTQHFLQQFYERLQMSQRMFYGHYMLNRWFSSRIPVLGATVSVATALCIIWSTKENLLSAGLAGLVLIYALSFWESLNWAVRIFAEVEARMTAVERLSYYASLEAERDTSTEPVLKPEEPWPTKGELVFDQVLARYAPQLPPVLKGISFRVPAGARVGIIGRTGSGKSTLLQALFRTMELSSGEIRIDGVNIAKVPLARLRRSIAIIPQDPTLFFGTVRKNLDRFEEFSEQEIWAALEKAKLADSIRALPLQLQAPVMENGANFSQGQRQLLCLARALLVDARVIVMDEATASVDVKTDNLVQEVIRKSCLGITMLIIAHRLGTVADCDFVIEVKEGKLGRRLELRNEQSPLPS